MSIVPGRDVPEVPQEWVDAVNKAVNDANHKDLCHCDAWPDACPYYKPGQWDIGVDLDIAVGALEPLIRDRIKTDARKPNVATVTRQLKAAGHQKTGWDERLRRHTPGFRVGLNEQITPDGVAVLHMHDPDGEEPALASYATTLRGLGYDAQVATLHARSGMRGVYVKRPAKEDRRG